MHAETDRKRLDEMREVQDARMVAQDLPSNHYDERSGLNNSAGAASIKHRVELPP